MVSINDQGTVDFHIAAVSAPASWSFRVAGPPGRAVQSVATSGYLRSMRWYVRTESELE